MCVTLTEVTETYVLMNITGMETNLTTAIGRTPDVYDVDRYSVDVTGINAILLENAKCRQLIGIQCNGDGM